MTRVIATLAATLAALVATGEPADCRPVDTPADVVRGREVAFARTMADRDHAAFVTFLSPEAIFVGSSILQGREAVAEGWRPLFEGTTAPFSWAPERVVVTHAGTLAISTGPVHNSEGERIGTFNSTWRLEDDGEWRVVLDIGCPQCRCDEKTPAEPAE
jgi:ketosteroid isomerase-like protein